MFTGIISACQPITDIAEKNSIRSVTIELPRQWQLQLGESISVNGVCSTVVRVTAHDFTVEYMPETLRFTTLNLLGKNAIVNLERSLSLQDLVSGHLVSGHVDGIATVTDIAAEGDSHLLTLRLPPVADPFLIRKGSIALNGVSLTVVDPESAHLTVAVIPHTWKHTNFHTLTVGDVLNVEYDLIAKYIAKNLSHV